MTFYSQRFKSKVLCTAKQRILAFVEISNCRESLIIYAKVSIINIPGNIIIYVRRPSRRPRITRRPPSHQNSKKMTDISLWVSILGLFGPLISIILLDFPSVAPSAGQRSPATRRYTKTKEDDRYIVMGIVFGMCEAAGPRQSKAAGPETL